MSFDLSVTAELFVLHGY